VSAARKQMAIACVAQEHQQAMAISG